MTTRLFFLFSLFFSFFSFQPLKLSAQGKKVQTSDSSSQGKYLQLWNRVDSLEQKGLNRSALELSLEIFNVAKADKNSSMLVKAMIHRMKFQEFVNDDAYLKSIQEIELEAKHAKFPETLLLHSMLGEIYWNYYQQNRYRFLDRTETVGLEEDNPATWDLNKIMQVSSSHYAMSLENSNESKATAINQFDEVLIPGDTLGSRKLRPTLYDFLAHRVLDFYTNTEAGLTSPAEKFQIEDNSFIADMDLFLKMEISKVDTDNFKYKACLIFKEILSFHKNDKDPGALIDADLKRIEFMRRAMTKSNKDSLYEASLYLLFNKYKDHTLSAEVLYQIALLHEKFGHSPDQSEPKTNKWEFVIAVQHCDTIIALYPGSLGAVKALNLKKRIELSALTFNIEQINPMGKEFLTLVRYKNIQKLYCRIVYDQFENFQSGSNYYLNDSLSRRLFEASAIKNWSIELPKDSDLQNHFVELAIPALDYGKYFLLISDKEDYKIDDGNYTYASFRISDLSLLSYDINNNKYKFYVLDRNHGKPIEGVSAEVTTNIFNQKSNKYDTVNVGNYMSDENGQFSVGPILNNHRNIKVKLRNGSDINFLEENFYQYDNRNASGPSVADSRIVFFTDRSIYRPGQLIYFKALILSGGESYPTVLANHETRVTFYDVNRQVIAEQKLTSNEYGTIEGVFTAPQTTMTGRMVIESGNWSTSISVEEYKRPRFEVVFKPLEGEYQLGSKVEMTGNASSFSGVPLDAANVKYRVSRQGFFPFWFYRYRTFPGSIPAQEILSGEIITDSIGNFSFSFIAKSDESINRKFQPVFRYSITADITDINGETRSATKILRVGYTSLELTTDFPEILNSNKKELFKIVSRNLSGNPVPTMVSLKIYKIHESERLLKSRSWNHPDKQIYSREEYIKKFPNDIYDDDDDFIKWEKETIAWSTELNTGLDSIIPLKSSNFKQGLYLLEGKAIDSQGEEVKLIHYFTVFNSNSKAPARNQFFYTNAIKNDADPGSIDKVLIGTAAKNAYFLLETVIRNEVVKSEWVKLNNEQKKIEIPVNEDCRGNFSLRISMVNKGTIFQDQILFKVPWKTKDLNIEYQSFRSTLEPGKKEEWKIKIKDHSGKFANAELLASMYDASLDIFLDHKWTTTLYPIYGEYSLIRHHGFGQIYSQHFSNNPTKINYNISRFYDRLNWFGYHFGVRPYYVDGLKMRGGESMPMPIGIEPLLVSGDMAATGVELKKATSILEIENSDDGPLANQNLSVRKNLQETAFFLPRIYAGEDSSYTISFSTPEALTRWKLQLFAHTKELEYAFDEKEIVTQKKLMLTPNLPRFLRAGDTLWLSAKINSLVNSELQGSVILSLTDAISMKSVDSVFRNSTSQKMFSASKEKSASVSWRVIVPENVSALVVRMIAKSGNISDGEEHLLPVLTNRQLVTESLPIWTRGKETKKYQLTKLLENRSTSLQHHRLKLEYTSNPIWTVVQALPYLMEYPYECAEQIFSRFFANSIASHLVNSSPRIKEVFSTWKELSPESFQSNLEKNEDLKSVVLSETPWIIEAGSEKAQKERIGLLFELNRMSYESGKGLDKLKLQQLDNGSWGWFMGMPENRYITQHIVIGLLQLEHLDVLGREELSIVHSMITKALPYLDQQIANDYSELVKRKVVLKDYIPSPVQLQYLYMRSFGFVKNINSVSEKEFSFFMEQTKKNWLKYNLYMQSMISVALNRHGKKDIAMDVINSLKDNAIHSEELGMYWKNNNGGYYWKDAAIETQAMLIEAFMEVADDRRSIEEMKIWLLRKKQVNNWKTTKATVAACYALMLRASNLIELNNVSRISIGNKIIQTDDSALDREAGSGHFSVSWPGDEIENRMGEISISPVNLVSRKDSLLQSPQISWGALYWQYFEDLDKITGAETNGLKLTKDIFVQRNNPSGPIIEKVDPGTIVKVGDKINIRIILKTDRDMEYLHLKDLRAAGLEPLNVLSGYKWQDGFGYYESTSDVATNFFISYLPRGEYVFEYSLRAFNEGDFSGGITTIQNMYAPEFSSHSFGERLQILRE